MAQNTITQSGITTIRDPSLTDLLNEYKRQTFLNLNCHHLGTIQSFDASVQTAMVTINYKKTYFEIPAQGLDAVPVLKDYPILIDCPVIVIGGGTAHITFPIKQGDQCVLLFNDRDLDNWYNGSTTSGNASTRLHAFSDAIALIGPNNLNTAITDYDAVRALLTNGTVKNGINPATNKLTLTNGTSLNTLLQDLCTEIKNLIVALNTLKVTGVTPGGATDLSGVPDSPTLALFSTVTSNLTATALQISQLIE